MFVSKKETFDHDEPCSSKEHGSSLKQTKPYFEHYYKQAFLHTPLLADTIPTGHACQQLPESLALELTGQGVGMGTPKGNSL